MALPTVKCTDCGSVLPLQVLCSNAGHYIGRFCPQCGPYSRVSGYFNTEEEAKAYLKRTTNK